MPRGCSHHSVQTTPPSAPSSLTEAPSDASEACSPEKAISIPCTPASACHAATACSIARPRSAISRREHTVALMLASSPSRSPIAVARGMARCRTAGSASNSTTITPERSAPGGADVCSRGSTLGGGSRVASSRQSSRGIEIRMVSLRPAPAAYRSSLRRTSATTTRAGVTACPRPPALRERTSDSIACGDRLRPLVAIE